MTPREQQVVEAWQHAARDLGIRFSSPFGLSVGKSHFEYIGFVHLFGRRLGTIISVIGEPSEHGEFPIDDDYFASALASHYGTYDRDLFIDTLDDWQYFGSDSERPAWYTG